jgi:mannose-1-phosphate guanylyltransferase/mannose-6-phosphate isomerase
MIQETVLRAQIADAAPPILLCNDDHRFMVAEQMQQIGVRPTAIVLEPIGRNTAPAAAVAALVASEMASDAMIVLLPSDHVVSDEPAFKAALEMAIRAAESGHIVTFGMAPTAPETGYGYIQRGAPLDGVAGVFLVEAFKEKPNAEVASEYLARGDYFWNGGMFVFRADVMLSEIERLQPDVIPAVREALAKSARDLDFIRLDRESFKNAPNISIDYAVMERTERAALVPCSIGWNDVGAWSSLWEVRPQDANGNVLLGDVITYEAHRSFVHSEKALTALIGVDDLVVVATKDAILVADKSRAQNVKEVVDQLKVAGRSEHTEHTVIFRPWGSYEVLSRGANYLVTEIKVKAGGSVSLHVHHHRAEHWVVVQGTARITCGEASQILHENQSTFIPIGQQHRLENPGDGDLRVIEVQSGSYLGADDITRLEDVYRKGSPPK